MNPATLPEELLLVALLAPPGKAAALRMLTDRLSILAEAEEASAWPADVRAQVERLAAGGDLRAAPLDRFELTPSGRTRALQYLGGRSVAPSTTWPRLVREHLCARALEWPSAATRAERERLATVDGLRAEVIRDHFDLPLERAPSFTKLRGKLGWALLSRGAPLELVEAAARYGSFNAPALIADVLMCGVAGRSTLAPGKGPAILAAHLAGAKSERADDLRRAVLRRLRVPTSGATRARSTIDADPSASSSAFIDAVFAAARGARAGWFDEERVFIAHVWRRLPRQGLHLSLEEFKARLLAENAAGRIRLGRAEMPQLMDPTDLRESRVEDRSFTFVFIKVPAEEAAHDRSP